MAPMRQLLHARLSSRQRLLCYHAEIMDHVKDVMQRRLLTASDDGIVRMWNFNSGALQRQFLSKSTSQMLTCLAFARGEAESPGQVTFSQEGIACICYVQSDCLRYSRA